MSERFHGSNNYRCRRRRDRAGGRLVVRGSSLDDDLKELVRKEIAPATEEATAQGTAMETLAARIDALDATLAEGATKTGALVDSLGRKSKI